MKHLKFLGFASFVLILLSCGGSETEETDDTQTTHEEIIEIPEVDFTVADDWLNKAAAASNDYCTCMMNIEVEEDCYDLYDEAAEDIENLKQSALDLGEDNNLLYLDEVENLTNRLADCQTNTLGQ